MQKPKFKLTRNDKPMLELIHNTDQKILAEWAIDCAQRVLPYFEQEFPDDNRPLQALDTLHNWIKTGEFKMSVIRGASLASHAAAREVGQDSAARSAARAAGQAVATAHVPVHAFGSALYAQQAIHRVSSPDNAEAAVHQERDWQYQHLVELRNLQS